MVNSELFLFSVILIHRMETGSSWQWMYMNEQVKQIETLMNKEEIWNSRLSRDLCDDEGQTTAWKYWSFEDQL